MSMLMLTEEVLHRTLYWCGIERENAPKCPIGTHSNSIVIFYCIVSVTGECSWLPKRQKKREKHKLNLNENGCKCRVIHFVALPVSFSSNILRFFMWWTNVTLSPNLNSILYDRRKAKYTQAIHKQRNLIIRNTCVVSHRWIIEYVSQVTNHCNSSERRSNILTSNAFVKLIKLDLPLETVGFLFLASTNLILSTKFL